MWTLLRASLPAWHSDVAPTLEEVGATFGSDRSYFCVFADFPSGCDAMPKALVPRCSASNFSTANRSMSERKRSFLRAPYSKFAIANRNGKLLVFRFGTQGLGQKLDLLHAVGFITDRLKMLRIDIHQHEIAI